MRCNKCTRGQVVEVCGLKSCGMRREEEKKKKKGTKSGAFIVLPAKVS